MCKVYNQIGCLTVIESHLRDHSINEFKSTNELINFKNNYSAIRQQIISTHKVLIEQEKDNLSIEVEQLNQSIEAKKSEVEQQLLLELKELKNQLDHLPSVHSNIIQTVVNYVKKISIKRKIQNGKFVFDLKMESSLKHLTENYNKTKNRHHFIVSRFEDAVMESSLPQIKELDRKKRIVDQINGSIYGALGEQKVVRELEKLSDDYILINDFTCRFNPPIYKRQENDYIRSIQVDHILIAPSGIFLIETKNWSEYSLNNPNLYSPVEQIKRSNFALYKMLNGETSNTKLTLKNHLWGDKKVPIRNLVVLINHNPVEEFQHVKILSLNKVLGYVKYFESSFSDQETQKMAKHLLNAIRK